MKKITIIYGASGSGKTLKAKSIAGTYSENAFFSGSNFIPNFENRFLLSSINEGIECIVIDDLKPRHLESVITYFSNDMVINRPTQMPLVIKHRPHIIITMDADPKLFFLTDESKSKIEFINLTPKRQ